MKKISVLLLSIGAVAFLNAAQMSHDKMDMGSVSEATKEYINSMGTMHDDMMKGIAHQDPDVAFAAGMIPHHEGAVKMAEIELKYGKDPELRKLAEDIIKAQKGEIEFMNKWLKTHSDKK